jgi:hypothetical protein
MKSLIMLSVNGSIFLFKDDNFNDIQKERLNFLAKENISYSSVNSESEIVDLFIKLAKEKLDIALQKLSISYIIRINQ